MNDLKYKTIEELELETKESKRLLDKYINLYKKEEYKFNLINEAIRYKKEDGLNAIKVMEEFLIKKVSELSNIKEPDRKTGIELVYLKTVIELAKKGMKK